VLVQAKTKTVTGEKKEIAVRWPRCVRNTATRTALRALTP
jgi:hypothetical protein